MNPICKRQKNESAKAFAASRLYCEQGPDRSLARVARETGKPLSLINRWSGRWGWVARAKESDDEANNQYLKEKQKRDGARARKRAEQDAEIEDQCWELGMVFVKKGREMANSPLYRQVTRDGKITLEPNNKWLIKDAIEFGEAGKRMAQDLTKAEDGQGDLREEGFEHMDFPAQDEKEPEKGEEEKE